MANGDTVTLDFSKAQPLTPAASPSTSSAITLDFSKAQPLNGGALRGASEATGIGPARKQPITDPISLGRRAGEATGGDWLAEGENLTQAGREAHPVQAAMGDLSKNLKSFGKVLITMA